MQGFKLKFLVFTLIFFLIMSGVAFGTDRGKGEARTDLKMLCYDLASLVVTCFLSGTTLKTKDGCIFIRKLPVFTEENETNKNYSLNEIKKTLLDLCITACVTGNDLRYYPESVINELKKRVFTETFSSCYENLK